RAAFSFFQLPPCIEISRARDEFPIPADLRQPYTEALQRLPALVGAAAARESAAHPFPRPVGAAPAGGGGGNPLCCALAAIPAAKGFPLRCRRCSRTRSED